MKISVLMSQDEKFNHVNTTYVNLLMRAGLTPLLVPFPTIKFSFDEIINFEYLREYLDNSDGILLTGGADIDPTIFGEENNGSMGVDPLRDFLEMSALNIMDSQHKKIFGICRGFQMIFRFFKNRYSFAKLGIEGRMKCYYEQDLEFHPSNGKFKIERGYRIHRVEANLDLLYGSGGIKDKWVNSLHHQGVIFAEKSILINGEYGGSAMEMCRKVYPEISALAEYTTEKGNNYFIVEGINLKGRIGGVQWHPEEMDDFRILEYFFKEV